MVNEIISSLVVTLKYLFLWWFLNGKGPVKEYITACISVGCGL